MGVVVAWLQLGSWKREQLASKKSALAEDLVATVAELKFSIKALRSPFGYGAPEGDEEPETYDYRRRLRELGEKDSDFAKLRHLKVRQEALSGSTDVNEAIEKFFEARTQLIVGLQGRIRQARGGSEFGRPLTDREFERLERYDNLIWEGHAEDGDPINGLIDPAFETINSKMVPLIRLEIGK